MFHSACKYTSDRFIQRTIWAGTQNIDLYRYYLNNPLTNIRKQLYKIPLFFLPLGVQLELAIHVQTLNEQIHKIDKAPL